ncbi:MAG: DNA repair protein RadC [Tannerella sp.]|jgi:DNA repair protein RadC|nr:DNA repair protein RadC [Tannerella sp.]
MNETERLRIKDWSPDDRPREKLIRKGVASLSDAELLAILIGSGNVKETAVQLAQRILSDVSNNLTELGKMTIKELTEFQGIGEAKAVTVVAAMELARRKIAAKPVDRDEIRSSRDAFRIFYPLLCDLRHEELWIALTNRSGKVIDKQKISQGGSGNTSADLRHILKPAISALCSGIVLCHNHPSGNIQPSREDDFLTSNLENIAKLLNIKLLDHLVMYDETYYSYADEGRLSS